MQSRWKTMAFCLVVAAAAGLAWAILPRSSAGPAMVAELVGPRRYAEPRLTGGFRHAPCRLTVEPGRLLPRAFCSSVPSVDTREGRRLRGLPRRIRSEARPTRGAEEFQTVGLAALALPPEWGAADDSVRWLSAAAVRQPGDASILSDLAAARFVLAVQEDDPAGLVAALEAAERAVQADGRLSEALFNRALILERLCVGSAAEVAWQRYLALELDSAWAAEAADHLWRLRSRAAETGGTFASLDATAAAGRKAALRRVVSERPQRVLEHVLEDLLGSWGDFVLISQELEADDRLRAARAYAGVLSTITGDLSTALTVMAVERATQGGNSALRRRLASGHRAYRNGIRAARDQDIESAAPHLAEAAQAFREGDSPAQLWAELGEARVAVARSEYVRADEIYAEIGRKARLLPAPLLEGRSEWGRGHVRIRQALFTDALGYYFASEQDFIRSREREGLGAVRELIAEDLRFLGQNSLAWRYRHQAACALSADLSSVRLHNVLWEGGKAALEDGFPEAARLFLEADVRVAEKSRQPWMLAEALVFRSRTHLARDDPRAALEDLARAEGVLAGNPGEWARQRIGAEVTHARGEALRRLDPVAAVPLLSDALDFYRRQDLALEMAEILLARARALLTAGRGSEAGQDLEEAIALFVQRRDAVADASLRSSFAETAQDLVDEAILFELDQRADGRRAFEILEMGRTLPWAAGEKGSPWPSPLSLRTALGPADTVLLVYAVVSDRLLIWVLHQGAFKLVIRPVPATELERQVKEFTQRIQARRSEERITEVAVKLYETLIPREAGIQPGSAVYFVPDKILNSVPFAALNDPARRRYLIEDHPVGILPSVSAFLAFSPRPFRRKMPTALVVAGTHFDLRLFPKLARLPAAEPEARAIAHLYPGSVLLVGAQATKARVLAEMDRHEVFQFSGHAVFNTRHPSHSYLVIAPSESSQDTGMLLADDLAGHRFHHLRLVVLSACSTLGPAATRTGGPAGLARPFLAAGAAVVMGTLWSVNDGAAAHLLPEFHRQFLSSSDAVKSLRTAQLSLLQDSDPSLRHPSSWAGFQVVGGRAFDAENTGSR